MPFRPGVRAGHTDRPMSGLSLAYMQDQRDFVLSRVTSPIMVNFKSDQIGTYPKWYWFSDEAQKRAPGTETVGSGYEHGSVDYDCIQYGFHKDVPHEVRDNYESPFDAMNDARKYVDQKLLIKKDVLLANTIFKTGVWATDAVGGTDFTKFSDWGASNPFIAFDNGRDAIHSVTAKDPNVFICGRQCMKYIKHHPALLERIKYTQKGVITTDLLASLLEVEKFVVGEVLTSSSVEGASSATYSYLYGKHGLLMHQMPRPGLMDATAFVTLWWKNNGIPVTIRRMVNEWRMFTRIEGIFNVTHKVLATDLGYFMSGLVD